MNVKQALEILTKCNPEAILISYSSDTEDASLTKKITENSNPYCKGETCDDLANGKQYVVIG